MKTIKAVVALVFAIGIVSFANAQDKAGKKDSTQHKMYVCPMHPDVTSDMPGKCSKCNRQLVVDRRGSKQASFVYTCSMHPDVVSDKPGKCPKCGMDLIKKNSPVHGRHKKDSTGMKMN